MVASTITAGKVEGRVATATRSNEGLAAADKSGSYYTTPLLEMIRTATSRKQPDRRKVVRILRKQSALTLALALIVALVRWRLVARPSRPTRTR